MRKIPTVFKRDPENMSLVLNEYINSSVRKMLPYSLVRQKLDGTCCFIDPYGRFMKRRTVRKDSNPPDNFLLCDYDEATGKKFGWVPVIPREDRYHIEGIENSMPEIEWEEAPFGLHISLPSFHKVDLLTGTYELIGPKINGNPEESDRHILVNHMQTKKYPHFPSEYSKIKKALSEMDVEGIVWTFFSKGKLQKLKIKKSDFGLPRKPLVDQ